MKVFFLLVSLGLLAGGACATEVSSAPQTDGEVWNAGVDFYRAGDVTNALRVLKPLLLSPTHAARAAEVVAKLEFERGNREESAAAAQVALRAAPDDAMANRNFTRATDGLLAERETKHINAVLAAAQGKDPGTLMRTGTYEARALFAAAEGFLTNSPAAVVAAGDALSARASALADAWIPVREVIAQSVTNAEQSATIMAQIEQAQAKTKQAAKEFGDLQPEAYAAMSDVEHDFTRFLKLTVLPPAAIGEDLVAQSNAWLDVETVNGRSWQQDALDYTRVFRAKFPAWAQAYEQQAQSDTNMPPFAKEQQDRISALATEVEKLQLECVKKPLPPNQEKAIELLGEIQALLPKDPNGGQQGQQGQSSPDDKNQQQQDQRPDQQQDQQSDQQNDQRQDQDPNQPEENPSEDSSDQSDGSEQEDQEVEAVLKKAQERNDEHEADKKARMRKAPLPPNERDW